jgi:hypothetical protein
MLSSGDDQSALSTASLVLAECAKVCENIRSQLITLDVVEHAENCIRAHIQNRDIVISSCQLLLQTKFYVPELKEKLFSAGFVSRDDSTIQINKYEENPESFITQWTT